MNTFGSKIAGGNPKGQRNAADFYPTPPEVTIALLDALELDEDAIIWDPACGDDDMVNAIAGMGYLALGSDIKTGADFLDPECSFVGSAANWIITNPPFSLAEEFIKRCIELNKPFALLLKSTFWHAEKRRELFLKYPPFAIHLLTWRPDFRFKEPNCDAHPTMDVCWNVWLMPYGTQGDMAYYAPLQKPSAERVKEVMG